MYWLCFYDGFDKPEVECAFSCPFMVVEYASHFIDSDRVPLYTVYIANSMQSMPLKKFLEDEKEKEF